MEFDLDALERRLLEYVARDGYQPVKPRVIIKKFGLDDEGKVAFRRLLKRLVRDGKLAYGANHLVRKADAVKPADGRIVGRFRRAMRGHGYVRPESPAPKGIVGDIYIPAGETGDAANGDRVAVRLSRRRHGGPTEPVGEIVEVLDRRTLKFVGTYLARGGGGFVRMDGNQFPDPIPVGDPGAKQVRDGDKVVVEMVRFPDSRTTGEAVVTEVLGRPDAVGVDTRMIVAEYDLPTEFPDEVVEEVRSIAAEFDESIAAPRRDLTGTTIITIDPATARDFDDAISLERIENGHWRLGVHIADVAHFVRPNSRVDGEALRRGNSVYLPDLVIPMLPELLSNGLASLQPDRVRYTLTAFVEFAPDGVPVATELCESAIRSCRRFTYEEIDQFLDDPDGWREKLTGDVHALLERMRDLARILRDRRMAAVSLDLAIPEVEIDLDADGRVVGAHKSVNTFSHQIIEEFMLAANVAVAQRIHGLGLPLVRRVHEPPGLMKLRELTEFVRALGIRCSGLHDRFEIKRVIAEAEGRPERDAIHFAVLRAMQKARYSSEELGHYALAFDAYCHFTSPIRRYPDLIIHRMVKALAAGTRPAAEAGHLEKLGEHCSETEQRAERAERELKKLKLLNFLKDKIGTELDARITGVESFGIFAQGEQLPADGYVAIRSLPPDLYDFDSVARSIVGRRSGETYRLGDSVVVKVARVDLARRELDFEIVRHRNRPVSIRPASNRSERSERATGEERPPR
ncbi:MAG TPA: ribonuclease R, partial [Planctomycetaceae bacterium]|nr:ribonuclease R [Planctomycetaceae bacterium]